MKDILIIIWLSVLVVGMIYFKLDIDVIAAYIITMFMTISAWFYSGWPYVNIITWLGENLV